MAETNPVIEMEIQSTRPTISMSMARSSAAAREVIDDTAGSGVTDKAWSADKNTQEFNGKADKRDTVLETTLSCGRKGNTTVGSSSIAFGWNATASGQYSVAIGNNASATNTGAYAQGAYSKASGTNSHAEGGGTASGTMSHAESGSMASGNNSHAEGSYTRAEGNYAHSEGESTHATGRGSHAEGSTSHATANYSHAEGYTTYATGNNSHAEGNGTNASGLNSHAEGTNTTANHKSQHVFGEFNIPDDSTDDASQRGRYIEIVGKGTATNMRLNARTLDWDGNEWVAGRITSAIGTLKLGNTTITEVQLQALLALIN